MLIRYAVIPSGGQFNVLAMFGNAVIASQAVPDRNDAEKLRAKAAIEGPQVISDVDPDAYVSVALQPGEMAAIADIMGNGHVTYADGAAEAEGDAQAIAADTRTLFTIDGEGAQTETRWRGSLPADTWAANTHSIDRIGRSFDWLLELYVKKTSVSTDALLTIEQDIGSDPTDTDSIVIFGRSHLLTKAQDVVHHITIGWSGYGKETYLANGTKFFITCDEAISVWGKEIFIRGGGVPIIA